MPTAADGAPAALPMDRRPIIRTFLKRRRVWLIGAILAAAVGAVAYHAVFGKATVHYTTAVVERGNLESTVVAAGIVQPINYVDVGAQTSGKLKWLKVKRGDTVEKNQLLAEIDPVLAQIGQYLLVGNAPFLVIGVLTSKGLDARGNDMDNSVWLPYTTAGARVFGQRFFNTIVVRVKPGADMSAVQAGLHTILLNRHGKEDFNIRNMADTIETASET